MFTFNIGCSKVNGKDTQSIKAPNNENLTIRGTWKVVDINIFDDEIENKDEILLQKESLISISSSKISIFNKIYHEPSFKLKVVDKNYILSYELDLMLKDVIDLSHNVDISISSVDRLRRIIKVLDNCTLNIHVKIDTGLNRYGIKEISQLKKIIAICKKSKCINLCGLMTHFATKSSDIDFVDTQYNKFITFAKLTPNAICHCANSYATIHDQNHHFDMCSAGSYL